MLGLDGEQGLTTRVSSVEVALELGGVRRGDGLVALGQGVMLGRDDFGVLDVGARHGRLVGEHSLATLPGQWADAALVHTCAASRCSASCASRVLLIESVDLYERRIALVRAELRVQRT